MRKEGEDMNSVKKLMLSTLIARVLDPDFEIKMPSYVKETTCPMPTINMDDGQTAEQALELIGAEHKGVFMPDCGGEYDVYVSPLIELPFYIGMSFNRKDMRIYKLRKSAQRKIKWGASPLPREEQ